MKYTESLMRLPRQCGRTAAICKAAKEIGAVVVCVNKAHASIVNTTHGVETICLYEMTKLDTLSTRPVLFDHYAVECLLAQVENDPSNLQSRYTELQDKVESIKTILRSKL